MRVTSLATAERLLLVDLVVAECAYGARVDYGVER